MRRSPAVARTRLLNWLIFNVLTGNNDASQRLQARPELGPTMAGESRCLRAIIHTVIKEMVVRLSV